MPEKAEFISAFPEKCGEEGNNISTFGIEGHSMPFCRHAIANHDI